MKIDIIHNQNEKSFFDNYSINNLCSITLKIIGIKDLSKILNYVVFKNIEY